MPSKKRERELARARLERRAARRAARARARRRYAVIGSVVAVLAVVGAVAAISLGGGGQQPLASPSTAPSASTAASPAGPVTCTYTKTPQAQGRTKYVGLPPTGHVDSSTSYVMTIATNRGDIKVHLLTHQAPCTVNSFKFLASKGYFDNTPCHRLTTAGIYVLQCGDPFGTGAGGPGYQFGDENLGAFGGKAGGSKPVTYPKGFVAMANAGPGTNGSQFFIVYKDSQLAPKYTPFGKVTQGLDIVEQVAKAGTADGGSDGKPKQAVTIKSITVTAPGASSASSASPSGSAAPNATSSATPNATSS